MTVLGKGRSIVGGTIKHELTRADVEKVLVNGFFPECERDAMPAAGGWAASPNSGLPLRRRRGDHAAPARRSCRARPRRWPTANHRPGRRRRLPTAGEISGGDLFNGGVFKGDVLRNAFSA